MQQGKKLCRKRNPVSRRLTVTVMTKSEGATACNVEDGMLLLTLAQKFWRISSSNRYVWLCGIVRATTVLKST